MMALKEMPKVGDKVRIVEDAFTDETHIGEVYEVTEIDGRLINVNGAWSDGSTMNLSKGEYEIVESVSDSQPDVTYLIANLGRRLSDIESNLATIECEEANESTDDSVGSTGKAEQIRQACDEVRDLLIRKNHDYGDSFAQQYAKYGLQSALIRMDDKMRRLETLTDGKQAQVAESIEDTLADLAGYALLALVEARAAH